MLLAMVSVTSIVCRSIFDKHQYLIHYALSNLITGNFQRKYRVDILPSLFLLGCHIWQSSQNMSRISPFYFSLSKMESMSHPISVDVGRVALIFRQT